MKFSIAVCTLILALTPATAQRAGESRPRPTIGLALEGGGALALAQVGVIEWLESNHIPIDYIAGTSMGGLVGGFYASGMTPAEMRRRVERMDWNELANGQDNYRHLAFRRKEDARALANTAVLGLRHGLILPSGLNSGQALELLLAEISLPYGETASFNDLPTPFRCVATDLVAAKQQVFDRGRLDRALRATMSTPGYYDPVLHSTDGTTQEFVDGGLLNNLPVDLVKAMGADIVIAVYLAVDPYDPNQPHSAVDVMNRAVGAVIAANERHNIEMADLLVPVDLSGFAAGDFSKAQEIMNRGMEAGERRRLLLSRLALDDSTWLAHMQRRESARKSSVPAPDFVTVELDDSSESAEDAALAGHIRSYFADQVGKPLDPAKVEEQIRVLMGMGLFSNITYSSTGRDGNSGLAIHAYRHKGRPPTLQPAIRLDGSDYLTGRFAFAARITVSGLGGFRSEWRNDLIAGSAYGFRSEYFHPLLPLSNWFIAPYAIAETRPLDLYRRSRIVALNRIHETGGGIDFGYSIGNTGEVRIGYQASYLRTVFRAGDEAAFPITGGRYGAARLSYVYDRVDDPIVPHAGLLAQANLRWVEENPGSSGHHPVLDVKSTFFQPWGDRATAFASVEGGTVFNTRNTGIPFFLLGGPQRLSAYGMNELFGNQYFLGRVGVLQRLNASAPITDGRVYLFASYEVGKMYGARTSTALPMDISAGVLIRTLIGPFFLGGSSGDGGHRKWYFQLGRFF